MTTPHIERMQEELAQLSERCQKLANFLHGQIFQQLPADERELMGEQLEAMCLYRDTLETRLYLAQRGA